jgi:transcriptional regulator of acetoin/glycerol metabolism
MRNVDPTTETLFMIFETLPLKQAKAELVAHFERHYVSKLLKETNGNIAEAARRAEVDRVTLFRMIRRCGLKTQT